MYTVQARSKICPCVPPCLTGHKQQFQYLKTRVSLLPHLERDGHRPTGHKQQCPKKLVEETDQDHPPRTTRALLSPF